jgi:NAD-dependent DNA ligase (contains BRCT domain type II)
MTYSNEVKPKIQLQNKLAQEFLEKETITIDGLEIKLWTGHSHRSVKIQECWNSIKSYTILNSCSDGSCGDVVFTGIMQIPRAEIAEYAVNLGFKVHSSVTSNTDYLIIGSENVSPTKVANALEFNTRGSNIKFIDELTFLGIIADNFDLAEHNQFSIKNEFEVGVELESNKSKKRKLKSDLIVIEKVELKSDKLLGKNIVISGTFENHSRDDLRLLVEQHNGKIMSSVSSKTTFILAGENIGPEKLRKSNELGITLVDEMTFLEMINV